MVVLGSLLVACGSEAATDEEEAGSGSATPAATLERFAGSWAVRAHDEAGDSIPGHVLFATGDPSGWTITFENRPVIPARLIDASGDIVVLETDPYESVLRPGVQVRVLFVHRLTGDRLSGRFWANYNVAGASAILRGTTDGTRTQ